MTNPEDDGDAACEPRLVELLAVHLVHRVLEEACNIATEAKESGEPWRFLTWHGTSLKHVRSGCKGEADETSLWDETTESRVEEAADEVVTSTPQKYSGNVLVERSLVGQGDVNFETQNDLANSNSFIFHHFDMCKMDELMQSNSDHTYLLTQHMKKVLDSALNVAFREILIHEYENQSGESVEQISKSNEYSGCSLMTTDISNISAGGDIAICETITQHDDDEGVDNATYLLNKPSTSKSLLNEHTVNVEKIQIMDDDNVASFENAYLSLNRDYEQFSDDDGDPVLQDPKGMCLQEVNLLTGHTSDDDISRSSTEEPEDEPEITKELAAVSAVSGASAWSKSSFVRRFRSQGSRLLTCLRGWWRRKTPGKRKERRGPKVAQSLCPISPDARRRTSSLLEHSDMYSHSPNAPVPRSNIWKFNTVNEAFVNSSRWKEYKFDVKYEECGE